MRKTFFACLFLFSTLLAVDLYSHPANAQLDIQVSNVDPLTKLPPDKWIYLSTHMVNGASVIGRPEVFLVNATGQSLISISCDGKWQLVGNNVDSHVRGNVAQVPAWSVTLVHTESFDGYCKVGLDAQSADGQIYHGALISPDKTFSNATFITFK